MMKKKNILLIGLAALTVVSCKSLYGTYERPDEIGRASCRERVFRAV